MNSFKTTPKISFCISSSGRKDLLTRCLASISKLYYKNYEVLVGWPHQLSDPSLDGCQTFFCENHVGKTRNQLKSNASGDWLVFLDEDTQLSSPDFVGQFLKIVSDKNVDVFGGFYSSSLQANFIDRAYNMTCNLWLLRSQLRGPQVLGGLYALRGAKFPDYYDGYSFGGEEYPYFSELIKQNSKILVSKELTVVHSPQHSLLTFFKRAWLHGKHKPLEDIRGQRWDLFKNYSEKPLVKVLAGLYFITVYAHHTFKKFSLLNKKKAAVVSQ